MSSKNRNYNNKDYSFKSENFVPPHFNQNKSSSNFKNEKNKEIKNNSYINIIINDLKYIKSKKNLDNRNQNLLYSSKKNISNTNSFKFYNTQNLKFINIANNNKKMNINNRNKENIYYLKDKRAKSRNNLGEKNLSYGNVYTDIPSINIFQKAPRVKKVINLNILVPPNNIKKSISNYYNDLLCFSNKKLNINIDNEKKGKKEITKGPEEMHWYFVKCIQEGKKVIANFDNM